MKKKKTKKKKTAPKNPICRKGMRTQTVLFHKDHWDKKTARKWLLEHAMKAPIARVEGNYLRYRQEPPGHFEKGSLRTKTIDVRRGVRLIVGCPKSAKAAPRARRVDNAAVTLPATVVELGKAIELSLDDETLIKFRGYSLCANPEGTRLYILRTVKKKVVQPKDGATIDRARRLYSRFTDFESEKAFSLQAADLRLSKIGNADHIVYQSDKWTGRKVEYIHEFHKSPAVWANKSKTVIAIIGPGINVRKEGITG